MDARPVERKPWAVLAYTVADDKGTGDSLDAAAKEELKSLCNAADFGHMSVAAQVDFKHTRGVFRGVLTEPPPKTRGFESIPADSHPLWRGIKAKLDRAKLRVLKEAADLNASRANVLSSFLRFGQRECPADRYVVFFYGHGYGPLGLFFDAESDDAQVKSTMGLATLSDSLQTVAERAAVVVFRACQANTLETAYQLRDAGEFMLASQSIVPIAGIWPWGTFLDVAEAGRDVGGGGARHRQAAGALPRDTGQPRAVCRRPVLAHRSGGGARDRGAVEGAGRRARRGPARRGPPDGVRGRPRGGAHRLPQRSGRARRSGAPRRADDVRATWRRSIATRWPRQRGRWEAW